MIDKFTVNINKTRLNSLSMFFSINGRCTDTCKDTYFLRYIGFDNKNNYLEQINAADTLAQNNNYGYFRVKNSLCLPAQTDTELYILRFEKFLLYPDQLDFGFKFLNNSLNTLLKDNFSMALELFKKTKNGVTDSIVKNFGIKLLFWIDKYFPILFSNESLPLRSPKFIYSGNIKEQEYIFLYLLACTGCDVLYLNPTTDASVNQNLLKLSQILICSNKQAVEIPNIKQPNPNSVSKSRPAESNKSKNSMDLHIMQSGENTSNKIRIPPKLNVSKPTRQRFILEYEELAKIASSVVMISVYNNKKECFKTGSGVMIGSEGYILTNFHVVSGGSYYGINVENDEKDQRENSKNNKNDEKKDSQS